jgi:hypothetical protein
MTLSKIYHKSIDAGQNASRIADYCLRSDDHEMHRLGVSLRDLSLSIAQALTSLSDETRKRIASA